MQRVLNEKIKVLKIKQRWGLRNCSLFGLQLSRSTLRHGILCVTVDSAHLPPCLKVSCRISLFTLAAVIMVKMRGGNRNRALCGMHCEGEEDVVKTMCLLTSCLSTCMSYQNPGGRQLQNIVHQFFLLLCQVREWNNK